MQILNCGRHQLSLSHPLVMGILNVTPDSFSDGGVYCKPDQALQQAERLLQAGAAILDIGGESMRPNAAPVSIQEEMDRVLPVLEALQGCGAVLSVDTRRTAVMQAALAIGVDLINDVSALEGEVFLGRSVTTHKNVSEATMQQVDAEIRRIIDEQYALARRLLDENRDKVEAMHRLS